MASTSPNPALDGESRVGEIIAILCVGSILSTIIVVLRCYCRIFMLQSFGVDDAVIIPAQILCLASAIAIGLESKYGLGRHWWVMPDDHYIPYMKSFYSSIIVYNVGMTTAKISILFQYRRIFANTALRKVIVFGLAFLICWGVTLCFLLPLICVPVAAFWNPDIDGFCLDNQTVWYIMAGVNVATDFAVFTMPIPVISSLQLPRRQRAMLFIVFTLGVFPCAVSIYRIQTLAAAAKSDDPTWDNIAAATFSFLELSVSIIAICLPTIRPVLVNAMPRLFGSLLRSAGQSNAPGPGGFPRSGPATGPVATHGSRFKRISTLRESDSTEGLRPPVLAPPSRLENDFEFGELENPARANPKYSVSVVGGWGADRNSALPDKSGIKTTTVVTQKVTLAGQEDNADSATEAGSEGRKSEREDRSPFSGR
ncbi:hypothetical protein VTK26DRAFT_452 [Humicola hyalothermophila]